jgi:hypothetical protein
VCGSRQSPFSPSIKRTLLPSLAGRTTDFWNTGYNLFTILITDGVAILLVGSIFCPVSTSFAREKGEILTLGS